MATLAPVFRQRFFDSNGDPLVGGKVWTYAAGTTTLQATYSDFSGAANTNPVILDADGYADIWLSQLSYKIVLMNSADVIQWTKDNISNSTDLNVATADYLQNVGISCSVASNALTIALKTAAGADASDNDPIKVGFRSSNIASGLVSEVNIVSALSTVISSGSTAGHGSATPYNLYVYLLNNAGVAELAWSSTLYDEAGTVSTTAEGGAGTADSLTLMYSTTARSNVAFRLIGKLVVNEPTAGQWTALPTSIQTGIGAKIPSQNLAPTYQTKTTTYTAAVTDGFISASTSSGAWTLSLFSASGNAGKTLVIKKTSSDTALLTIDPNGSETIDGATTIRLLGQNEAVRLISDGLNWVIDSAYLGNGLSASASALNSKANNSNWEDAANLSLCPGTWELSGQIYFLVSGGATTTGGLSMGISTTSGNSATGLIEGVNRMAADLSTGDGNAASATVAGYRVTVSSQTTYYLKMKKENGGANMQYGYNLTAKRLTFI